MTTTARDAVHWDEQLGAFMVTGYDEASAVLRGTGWSSDPRLSPLAPGEIARLSPSALLFMDPPEHTRLRRLIAPAFTPRAIERLRPRTHSIVSAALDGLDNDTDLVAEYGYVIPLAVIAELLDVGSEGAEVFVTQTPRLVRMLEIDASRDELGEATAASFEMMMFLVPILAERRQHPRDDFISALLATDELSLDEVAATCVLLLAAGYETTANLIGNGALALLEHPTQRGHLFADPRLAVEELLRFSSPVRLVGRVALTDHALAGQRIDAGQQVLVEIGVANRDPRRFGNPDQLDLARPGPPNLGFGSGMHFCLGASLARLEATDALVQLFVRYPELRLTASPIQWRQSTTFRGLRSLRVQLDG